MKWCGGVEQKGKVTSSAVLPDMHVPLYEGMASANSANLSGEAVFAIG